MARLRRPTDGEIAARLESGAGRFTYHEVGATRNLDPPLASLAAMYNIDHYEFDMGRGPEAYERCRASLMAWRHFEIPWLELHGATAPASDGQVVATLLSVGGLWFFNPCEVVYTAQSDNFAEFAYGTLQGHPEQGEERFRVSLDPATQTVRYVIDAFSRPAIFLTRVGAPLARRMQRRFAKASAAALARAAG